MEVLAFCIPLHERIEHRAGGSPGRARPVDMTVYRVGLQESLFFLLFFRKDGVRNFFFFLDGDLPGDPSLPGSMGDPSSVAGDATSSAPGAEAEWGLGKHGLPPPLLGRQVLLKAHPGRGQGESA